MKLITNLSTKEVADFILDGIKKKHPKLRPVKVWFNVANSDGSYYDDGVGAPAFVGCDVEIEEGK